jgi:putative PEP-CTERM system TPR-repeat lipoprotein
MRSVRVARRGVLALALGLAGCGALIPAHYRVEFARKDLAKGNWHAAGVELHTVVQSHPKNAEAWLLLTRLALDTADFADAQANLNHALTSGAKGPQVERLEVRTWLDTGQPQVVLDAFAHHRLAMRGAEAQLAIARAYLALGQPDKAIPILNPLLAANPADTQARVVLAEALGRQRNLQAAMQQLDLAMQHDRHSPEPPLLMGRILASVGNLPAAEQSLALAVQRMRPSEPVPYRLTALSTLTSVRLAQGEIDRAAESQAALARLEPGAPLTRLLDARIKLARHDLPDAINELERVVADVPNFVEARTLLGAALYSHGDLEQAQEQLERALQQAPANPQARALLAAVQLKLNEPQAALNVLTPELDSKALNPQMLALLQQVADRAGNQQVLIAALERSVKAQPDNQVLKLNLAQIYLDTNHADKALALLTQMPDAGDLRRDGLLVAALTAVKGAGAAAQQVSEFLHAYPGSPGMLRLAAGFYVRQGHPGRAQTLLEEALRADPNDVQAIMALAQLQSASGNSPGAEQTLRAGLAANPKTLPIRIALAQSLAQEKHFKQAVSLLNDAHAPASDPTLAFARARVYLAENDLPQANAALDHAIALEPGSANPVELAGVMLLQAKEYSAALSRFEQATTLEPNDAAYWLNTARAQMGLKQPLAARGSLEKATQLRPAWLPAVAALTVLDLRDHNGAAALGRLDALLEKRPNDPGLLALKGDVELVGGDLKDAQAAYEASQRIRPSADVAAKLFQVALDAHRPDPQKPLEDWLAKEPNDVGIRDVLGNYYLTTRQLPAAAKTFQAVLRLSPDNLVALNNLAWLDSQLGNPDAQSLAERAYRLAPQAPSVEDTLGWILARKHDTARALPLLGQAATASHGDPEIEYHYAYALVAAGQRAEARKILTRLLATPSKFESRHDAKRLLAATRT